MSMIAWEGPVLLTAQMAFSCNKQTLKDISPHRALISAVSTQFVSFVYEQAICALLPTATKLFHNH